MTLHTRILRPERILPEELDSYLARGWYRIGQTLMTCRFVLYDGNLRSAVWTRSPLPKTSLGRKMATKLKVYRGGTHPHTAQKPEPFTY